MNRSLVASFVLRFQDRASAGIGALQRRLQRLAQAGRRIALLGGIGAGLTFAGPISQAAALEGQMRQTAITAGLSGEAVEQMMSRNLVMFQGVARETNVRVRDLAAAAGTLVAGGGRAGEVWEQLVPIIGRVAAASGAGANDLSQSVLAMVNNLGLAPDQVEQALAGLVQAGKEGQFELRDMAREFASLTAAAAGVGMRGPAAVNSLAAALQIARQGAGSAGEAATNLSNILAKMTSPDARRNFQAMGVNLEGVLTDAAARGINPFEAVVQKIRKITGGNMFRVGELFQDQQVLAFLRPMLQQTERYIEVRDRAAGAGPELISTDQATAMRGLAAELQRVTVAWDELTTKLGLSVTGPLRALGDGLTWLADRVRGLDERFPGLAAQAGWLLGGLAALTAGAGALGFVLGPIGAGFAVLASPIGLVVAAVVGLGLAVWAIYDNWSGISAWFQNLWTRMRPQVDWLVDVGSGAVSLVMAAWGGISAWFQTLWTELRPQLDWLVDVGSGAVALLMAAWTPIAGFFRQLWDGITGPVTDAATAIGNFLRPAWENSPLATFFASVSRSAESLLALFGRLQAAWDALTSRSLNGDAATANAAGPAVGNVQARQAAAAASRTGGFYAPGELAGAAAGGGGAPPTAQVGGEVVVRAAPGTEIVSTQSTNPQVPIAASGNRGATRGRP